MSVLVLGLVIFLGVHSLSIVNWRWRDRMVARMGEGPWMGLYSLAAVAGLVLVVQGYGMAREAPVVLYVPPVWLRHVTAALMLPMFPLLLAAYLPGRIRSATRHPMLAAVLLWAIAHLLANGTVADVLLFGGFFVWAAADRISLMRRPQPAVPGAPPTAANDIVAIVAGLGLYVAFVLWLHAWLIGMPVVAG